VTKQALPSAQKLLERGGHELERAGVADFKWEAERLLRHALGWTRDHLIAHSDEPVTAEASGHFFQLLQRRRGREPLQYVLGVQEFWGMELRVTPSVLIPRPETEGLVEQTLQRFESGFARIVDVGCGSGCIALALASALPRAEIFATEVSHRALAVARENAGRHELAGRIQFLQGDLLAPLMERGLTGTFHAVVSNPPYIPDSEMLGLEPEVRDYEPRVALAAGENGLDTIQRLIPQAEEMLAPGGYLFMEIGHDSEPRVKELLSETALAWEKTVPDLQGIPRVFIAKKTNG
jgi:release factor glutamine methyltransferase